MAKIAILGKTGMLGSCMEKIFSHAGQKIISTTRNELDAQTCQIEDIIKILSGCDYCINCIGIINSYIHDNNYNDVQRAIEVNALFPNKLAKASSYTKTKVIQIATDCVFDGTMGLYDETSRHNAYDVYGKTKSLGEITSDLFLNLRCSIIGREKKSYLSLMEWFLRQPKNAKVNGFANHYWNGVTTDAFSRICLGIIVNNNWFSGFHHLVPKDIVTKAQMLKMFADTFCRTDIQIAELNTDIGVNRTLSTINPDINHDLWKQAGYFSIPSVLEMIQQCKRNSFE